MADHSRLFKESDITGVYPIELTEEFAFLLGKALATYFENEDIVVGRDCRIGSDKLAEAVIKGITMQGANAVSIGMCAMPVLSFACQKQPGVMVTGSHLPKEFNGFKICGQGSRGLGGAGLQVLKDLVERDEFPRVKKKGAARKRDVGRAYLNHLKPFRKGIRKGLHVVVDAGNGVGGMLAKKVFPCRVTPLFATPDGSFPHRDPAPGSPDALIALSTEVRREKADLGIAYDGDGDAVWFVDEKGNVIPPDLILVLLARHVLDQQPHAKILYDVRSSRIVKDEITKNTGIAIMTRVGHTFVNDLMREEQAALAGELSGHYYFAENLGAASGDIAALMLLQTLSEEKKSLSRLVAPLQKQVRSGELKFAAENPLAVLEKVEQHYHGSGAKIFNIDGLSVEFDAWGFNLRPSHHESAVLLTIEAGTKRMLELRKNELAKLITARAPAQALRVLSHP